MVTAGVYLLIRSSPLIEYSSTVLLICLWLGAVTTIFSSLIGLFQQDIKKVIAYSTMSQLGMMVIAIGLSSYHIALFHLINHAFYKGLLFLSAGSVIHAISDNQDFRKYGGLIYLLPLTYSVMLIGSLSLIAFPFMTGFYSKDFILESIYGQYSLYSISLYIIAVIGAIFTSLYSVKILYLIFFAKPNGAMIYYNFYLTRINGMYNKLAKDSGLYMKLPLIILGIFSVIFGYLYKDLFVGLGSNLYIYNSIFIHPIHEIMINTEIIIPTIFKLLPLMFTVFVCVMAIYLSEFKYKIIIKFKLSKLGYNIFGFFNKRFYIELFYNKFITNYILNLGGKTLKLLDKGSVELVGPFGLEKYLIKFSKVFGRNLNLAIITDYALYIIYIILLYLYIYYLNISMDMCLLVIIFIINIIYIKKK
jgi:NADH-ubiquinone oxidoreductase chain 5